MRSWNLLGVATISILAAGCGGGGGGSSSAAPTPTPSATTYNYVAPTLNSQLTFARTIVDNANNTINQTVVEKVTAINADGSVVTQSEDPNHNSITVDGTLYSVPTATTNSNGSGQVTSETRTSEGTTVTCTYTPHAAGPGYPFVIGDTWSSSWNETCGTRMPITYTQTGSIVNTESITVPAGTYNVIKLQSTVSWTDGNGTTHTDSRTTWKEIAPGHSHTTIKEQDSYSYSGTTPTNGYPVTITLVLQNQS